MSKKRYLSDAEVVEELNKETSYLQNVSQRDLKRFIRLADLAVLESRRKALEVDVDERMVWFQRGRIRGYEEIKLACLEALNAKQGQDMIEEEEEVDPYGEYEVEYEPAN